MKYCEVDRKKAKLQRWHDPKQLMQITWMLKTWN